MRNTPWWVHPSLLFAGLLYGANYSIAKDVMVHYIEPYGLNLIRVLTAIAVFWLAGSFHNEKVDRADVPRFLLCALFGASLNITLFFKGLSNTTPVNASLIITASPIVVLLAARTLSGERINAIKVIGIIIGLSGAIYLLNTNEISLQSKNFIGDLTVLINITFYSLYLVLVKPLMLKYHPTTILKWIFTIGAVIVIPIGYQELMAIRLSEIDLTGYLSLVYVALATSVVAYYLNIKAIGHLSSTVVGYYIYLQPLFAGLIEVAMGRQAITTDILISAGLIFLGVFLVGKSV